MVTPEELTTVSRTQRTRHRWTPEEIAILGTIPDEDAAAKIGVTVAAVSLMRYKHGIPPFGCTTDFLS